MRPSRGEKLFNLGFKKYQSEMQVTYILKQLRVFNAFIRSKMTKQEYEILWLKHSVRDIEMAYDNIDDEDDGLQIRT